MKKGLIVNYILTSLSQEAKEKAEAVAVEQSVELPRNAVKDHEVAKSSIPDIIELTPICVLSNGLTQYRLRLAFSSDLVGRDVLQFFNLLFGNISLKKGLLVEDVTLPDEILDLFPGPGYGIKGIREICQCPSGALLCSVLKPIGSSTHAFAEMAEAFAKAGVPFIKDDHGLTDQISSPFSERIKNIQAAIHRAGSKSIYLPNITGPIDSLEEKIGIAVKEGVKGVLVSPFLIGLDTFRCLREKYPILWMTHPAFSGAFFANKSHGFRPGLLLGTILRLLGADMVIYPDSGGRFSFTPDECLDIANCLREGFRDEFRPAMPVPAGGISLSRILQVRDFYGDDVMLLIGGSIYLQNSGLENATRELLGILSQSLNRNRLKSKRSQQALSQSRSGLSQAPPSPHTSRGVTKQIEPGVWKGTSKFPYKIEGTHFKGITKTHLYVPECEEASFDVRYFEIEPGGFTSFERHQHIHFVIGVRGAGEVRINDRWHSLSPNDFAFIPKNCPHQLRNKGSGMFGFYCIVNHQRDEPTAIERNNVTLPE